MEKISSQKRSQIMRAVKSRNNKSTELLLIRLFKNHHIIGWRRFPKITGNPDFYFPKFKAVIFVDGCFWHGHSCRKKYPATNSQYWKTKISNNRRRDKKISKELKLRGYRVIRIWECDLKKAMLKRNLLPRPFKQLIDVIRQTIVPPTRSRR